MGTGCVVQSIGLVLRELAADLKALAIWDVVIPERKAVWVAVVTALALGGCVQEAVKVELLAWVVLVHVGPVPEHLVDRVLDAKDAATRRLFRHADRVAQPPAQHPALGGVVVGGVGGIGHVERTDLGNACRYILGSAIDVAAAAFGDEEHARLFGRHQERPSRMPTSIQVLDHSPRITVQSAGLGVVGPRQDLGIGRGVQSLTVI